MKWRKKEIGIYRHRSQLASAASQLASQLPVKKFKFYLDGPLYTVQLPSQQANQLASLASCIGQYQQAGQLFKKKSLPIYSQLAQLATALMLSGDPKNHKKLVVSNINPTRTASGFVVSRRAQIELGLVSYSQLCIQLQHNNKILGNN